MNVFFDIILEEGDDYEIEFSFESESLKHKLGKTEKDNKTMRDNMLQVSSANILERASFLMSALSACNL